MQEFIKYPNGIIGKNEWCDHCKTFNSRKVACTVIAEKDSKIVMVKRAIEPFFGYWCLPGGYLFWDESAEQCAQREFMEETGHQLYGLSHFSVYSDPNRDERQNIDIVFCGQAGVRVQDFDDETSEVGFFDLGELPEQIAADHRDMIEEYESRRTST